MAAKRPRRPGRPPDPKRAKRILDAADRLFCSRGFSGVSLRDVAEAAETNKALVLYYYESKGRLFESVLERYYREHADVLANAVASLSGADFKAQVHGLLDAYFDFMDQNRRYARLIQQEVARAGEHLPLIRKNLAAIFELTQTVLEGHLPSQGPLAPRHFFLSLSGMTINYFTYAPALKQMWGGSPMSAESKSERRAHIHWVADCMLAGLDEGA